MTRQTKLLLVCLEANKGKDLFELFLCHFMVRGGSGTDQLCLVIPA